MGTKDRLSLHDILWYETHSSCIARYISNSFLQDLFAVYLDLKVSWKYRRYAASLAMREEVSGSEELIPIAGGG